MWGRGLKGGRDGDRNRKDEVGGKWRERIVYETTGFGSIISGTS